MTMQNVNDAFNFNCVHSSWMPCLSRGLSAMDPLYLQELQQKKEWLPGNKNIFNAFSLPLTSVNYVLFGESPYPRIDSANGYAFWDAAIHELWSETGFNKKVNRATSFRNILKMSLSYIMFYSSAKCNINLIYRTPLFIYNKTITLFTKLKLFKSFLLK